MVLKFVYTNLRISEIKFTFFLNWFEIKKWNFANAPMMMYISKTYYLYNCLIL
jgi:DNA primase catalytic subunit